MKTINSNKKSAKVIDVTPVNENIVKMKKAAWAMTTAIGRGLVVFIAMVMLLNMSFLGWTQEKQMVLNWMMFLIVGAKAYKKITWK